LFRADGRTDEQKDRDSRRTDMTKLTVAFFAILRTRLKCGVASGTTEALEIAGTKLNNGVASLTYRLPSCDFRQDVNLPYIIHPVFGYVSEVNYTLRCHLYRVSFGTGSK